MNLRELLSETFDITNIISESEDEVVFEFLYGTHRSKKIHIEGTIISAMTADDNKIYIESAFYDDGKIETATFQYELDTFMAEFYGSKDYDEKTEIQQKHIDYLTNKSRYRLLFVTGLMDIKR